MIYRLPQLKIRTITEIRMENEIQAVTAGGCPSRETAIYRNAGNTKETCVDREHISGSVGRRSSLLAEKRFCEDLSHTVSKWA